MAIGAKIRIPKILPLLLTTTITPRASRSLSLSLYHTHTLLVKSGFAVNKQVWPLAFMRLIHWIQFEFPYSFT